MNKQFLQGRLTTVFSGLGVLVLVLACIAFDTIPALATDASSSAALHAVAPSVTAPPTGPTLLASSWMDLGNSSQARMLQVGLIVIAIGIFLLSRSIR